MTINKIETKRLNHDKDLKVENLFLALLYECVYEASKQGE